MDNKGHSDEVSDRNEEHTIGNWRKGDPGYKVANNLTELCLWPSVLWKVELVSNEIGYQAEAISRQSVDGSAQLLLNTQRKIQERNDLKTELLTQREAKLKNSENSQSIPTAKNEKTRSEKNTKIVIKPTFDEYGCEPQAY